MSEKEYVFIKRQWSDWRIGMVELSKIQGLRWSYMSGGVHASHHQPFVYGYVQCTDVIGDIAHSCVHGEGPHSIKVCIVKKGNEKLWRRIISIVGPKPKVAGKR